jgi:hypothetical protein
MPSLRFQPTEIKEVERTVVKIPLSMLETNLVVEFDKHGCLKVPEISSGLEDRAINSGLLADYGQLLRQAQTSLDRMPTVGVDNMGAADWRGMAPADVMYNKSLAEGTSEAERAVFEELRRLNAEVVLRVLVMRNLAVAAQIGR